MSDPPAVPFHNFSIAKDLAEGALSKWDILGHFGAFTAPQKA
jgi:hypothetical protein